MPEECYNVTSAQNTVNDIEEIHSRQVRSANFGETGNQCEKPCKKRALYAEAGVSKIAVSDLFFFLKFEVWKSMNSRFLFFLLRNWNNFSTDGAYLVADQQIWSILENVKETAKLIIANPTNIYHRPSVKGKI